MTMTDERPRPLSGKGERSIRRTVWAAVGAFVAVVVVFWCSWPAGVVLGLVLGVVVVVRAGQRMQAAAQEVPVVAGLGDLDDELWQEFRRLRVRLGDDWTDFCAAALAVTRRQSASAAGLRQELGIPTGQAQHLLQLLEREGFVGPPRGTQARHVRIAQDQADALRELLHA